MAKKELKKTKSGEPFGRPVKYKDEYCQLLIDHMAKGFSFESFAGIVGVGRTTIYDWESRYDDFSYAKTVAMEKNRVFWESAGMQGMFTEEGGPKFNATAWVFNMKNRFNWSDRQLIDQKTEVKVQSLEDYLRSKEAE